MNLQDSLTVLKFSGLLLATGSAIWGTLHDVTVDKGDRKVLTKEGRIAIGLTVIGLVVSATMILVSGSVDRDRAERRAETERRQLRETVLAGQPLQSLQLTWSFLDVQVEHFRSFQLAEEEILGFPDEFEEQFKYLYGLHRESAFLLVSRFYQLYPWMNVVAGGDWGDGPVVALISLDQSQSTVLPFGYLSLQPAVKDHGNSWGPYNYETDSLSNLASSVETDDALEAFLSMGDPVLKRHRHGSVWPKLRRLASSFEIQWTIDPPTLFQSIDVANPRMVPTANLPETVSILMLHRIADLPVDPANLSIPKWPIPWPESSETECPKAVTSFLHIVPNNHQDFGHCYAMEIAQDLTIEDSGYETQHYYAEATFWTGTLVAMNSDRENCTGGLLPSQF